MNAETSMGGSGRSLEPTLWTLVRKARDHSAQAIESLIRAYWKPAYFYVRRWGASVEDAKDLTQGFFAEFVERDFLKDVSEEKGRFRTFLLTTLKHYLINEAERARAQKRGGGKCPLSLDFSGAESHYIRIPSRDEGLDGYFQRQWALTVLQRALDTLEQEIPPERFAALRRYLSPEKSPSYAETARDLGTTEADVRSAIHRARVRYRELIQEEVRSSLDEAVDVEDEIRDLFSAL